MSNKKEELAVGTFFVERLNALCGTDYVAQSNEDEAKNDSDVDVYAISKNNKMLKLQMKTGEPDLKAIFPRLQKEAKITKKNVVFGDLPAKGIFEDLTNILRKEEKRYSTAKDLVLIIHEDFGPLVDGQFLVSYRPDLIQSLFKGVYLVKLPSVKENSSYPHDGQVVAIKDIFGNYGKSF